MTATELRIGNLVKITWSIQPNDDKTEILPLHQFSNDLKLIEVRLHKNGIRAYAYDSVKLEPIPLTEEWLLKFGFEKIGMEYRKIEGNHPDGRNNTLIQILDYEYIGTGDYSKSFVFLWGQFVNDTPAKDIYIKHVHQLQNLYFALTGTELTINNETHISSSVGIQ